MAIFWMRSHTLLLALVHYIPDKTNCLISTQIIAAQWKPIMLQPTAVRQAYILLTDQ